MVYGSHVSDIGLTCIVTYRNLNSVDVRGLCSALENTTSDGENDIRLLPKTTSQRAARHALLCGVHCAHWLLL